MQRTALALVLIGCSGPAPTAPRAAGVQTTTTSTLPVEAAPRPSVAPPPPIAFRELAHFDDDVALASGANRTLIVDAAANWHELSPSGTLVAAPIGDAVNAVCRGHAVANVMLATVLTAICDNNGHTYRFEPVAKRIATPGTLEQIGVGHGGVEVWRYHDRGVMRLALFDGKVTRVPSLPALGSTGDGTCAAPSVVDLASNGEVVVGLVTECNPDTPARIVEYRWPGPTAKITQLESRPEQVTITEDVTDAKHTVTVVGFEDGHLALKRLDGAVQLGPAATKIEAVISANDGAVWAITSDAQHDTTLTRDGTIVALPDRLHAIDLAFDASVGLIVKAVGKNKYWLLVERGATTKE